jgi:hypothetical protein
MLTYPQSMPILDEALMELAFPPEKRIEETSELGIHDANIYQMARFKKLPAPRYS